jgi:hypothetical protein
VSLGCGVVYHQSLNTEGSIAGRVAPFHNSPEFKELHDQKQNMHRPEARYCRMNQLASMVVLRWMHSLQRERRGD